MSRSFSLELARKVFEQGGRLPVVRVVPLKPPDHGGNECAVEKGVFAVAFFGPPPARVAAQVGVRGHDDQVGPAVLGALGDVARLVPLRRAHPADGLGVPGLGHTDGLRERRGRERGRSRAVCTWPCAGRRGGAGGDRRAARLGLADARPGQRQPVQALGVVGPRDPQARHAGARREAGDLLVQRQERDQVGDPILGGPVGVLERVLIRGGDGLGVARPRPEAEERDQEQQRQSPHSCRH